MDINSLHRVLRALVLVCAILACASAWSGEAPVGFTTRPLTTPFLGMPTTPADANLAPSGITTAVAYPNLHFQGAIAMAQAPRSQRFFVCEREGKVWSFDRTNAATGDVDKVLALDLTAQCQGWDDCGVLGIAFHPEFGDPTSPNRNYVYIYYEYSPHPVIGPNDGVHRPDSQTQAWNRLSRFTIPDGSLQADPQSELVLINQYDRYLWHNGGGMFFHPRDHFLYLTNGDEGQSGDFYHNTQRISKGLFSGVLRLDVDFDPAQGSARSHAIPRQPIDDDPNHSSFTAHYGIPNDNPFVGLPGVLEEFYAIGLRSPHRMTYDDATQTIWEGEIGQDSREEINQITRGGNYQWAYQEGRIAYSNNPRPGNYTTADAGGSQAGAITVAVNQGTGTFQAGDLIRFGALPGVYTVDATSGFPVASITFHPGLTLDAGTVLANGTVVVKTSGFTSSGASATAGGLTTIPVAAGPTAAPLAVGQAVVFGGVSGTFTITATSGAPTTAITITPSLPATLATATAVDFNTVIGIEKPPLIDFPRSALTAIIGGYVYRGARLPELYGKFVFGDNPSGNLFALDPGPVTFSTLCRLAADYQGNANGYRGLSSFACDSDGELYALRMQAANADTATSTGQIYTIVHNPSTAPPTAFLPQHLSATGAFQPDADGSIASMTPAPALVPYTVNSPLWSDGALKKRWIALPNPSGHTTTSGFTADEQVHFQPTGEWTFPTGTVFVKHFDLTVNEQTGATRRLETRLLVQGASGSVYGVTYRWRPDGLDAELLDSSVNEDIQVVGADGITRTQTWYYPSRNDCLTCHNDNANHVLGVKTRQLNGTYAYPSGVTDNQLRTWSRAGMFDTALDDATIGQFAATVPITASGSSLETRARSFIDSNCAHCHRPGGVHDANWDARFDTPLAQQGIVDVAANIAIPSVPAGLRIVAHNDTTRSALYLRDSSLDPAIKMPPLAKNVVDDPAMVVLRDWIATLRAPATVTLGGLAQVYDGGPKAATATSSPASAFITISYGASSAPPTGAGTYAVTATIDTARDGDLSGTASGTLVIGKATAGVAFGANPRTYTGSPQAADVATNPAGLGVALSYNGSATVPTDAGTYTVGATVVDANYQGAATGSMIIAPAAATVTLGALSAVYDGTAKAVTVTTAPAGLPTDVIYTYAGSAHATPPTEAGTASVTATVHDPNHQGSATGTLTIAPATATVALAALSAVYDGTAKAVTVTTVPAGLPTDVVYTYGGGAHTTPPTEAGTASVVATVRDADHVGAATGTLTIAPAAAAVTLGALNAVYDGTPKAVTVTTVPPGLPTDVVYTYGGGAHAAPPTEAGTATVVATIHDVDHVGAATGTLTIAPAAATVTLGALDALFDGTPKQVTVTTAPVGLATSVTYDGSATPPTDAHAYAVVATITDPDHQGTASGTLTIAAVDANIILGGLTAVYDGTAKAITATTNPPGLPFSVTYDGGATPPTSAGAYAVVATITDPNQPGSATGTLTIAPAAATVTLDALSAVYDGGPKQVTVTTVPTGLATTVTYDGSTTPPTDARAYAVVATITDHDHQGSAAGSLTIVPAAATVTLGALDAVYDGTPRAVTVTTTPPGLALTITYDGGATPPTGARAYGVVAAISDGNHVGSATGTLTIAKAPLTVVAADLVTTTGAPIPTLAFHLQGLVGSDGDDAISGAPLLATTATPASAAGSYPITCDVSGVASANYTVQGRNGTLQVVAAGAAPPPAAQPGGGGSGCGAGSGVAALVLALLLVLEGLRLGRGHARGPDTRRRR